MIQSYNQLQSQIKLVNEISDDPIFIQKIYSTSFYICLSLRARGKTWYLYIGRGHGKEGIWLDDKKPESFLRKRDRFLEYFRKHLGASQFKSIEIDPLDRIFAVEYYKWGHINKLYIFYNARNLYFSHHFFDQKSHLMKLFSSWTTKTEVKPEVSFEQFDDLGRTDLNKEGLDIPVKSIHQLLAEEKRSAMAGVVGGKSIKFFKRKKKKILGDLKNVSQVSKLKEIAEDEKKLLSLPMKNNLDGVRLRFQYQDYYKRRDEVYTKIKKLKKAESILSLRLKDTEDSLANYDQVQVENQLKIIPVIWKSVKQEIKEIKNQEKQFKVIDLGKIVVGIGTTAVGNDQLRSEWANKSDYWFHLDGDKSAHIIIKLRDESLGMNIFEIAGSALLEFSDVDYAQANLIYTQVKNLKGVKGAAGKVIFKKEKRIQVYKNTDWRAFFLNS